MIPGLVRWGEEDQEFKVIMGYTEEFRVRLLGEKKKPLKVRSHKAFCVPSNTQPPPPILLYNSWREKSFFKNVADPFFLH